MTRDHTCMKVLRESYMQGALNNIENKMKKMRHHLQLDFELDTTDFKEVEVLSHFCSELYFDKLPISDEVVRILLRKLRKCQDILRRLRMASAENKEHLAFISAQLSEIFGALSNIKRNATHLKYASKDVDAIVKVTQSVNLLDVVVPVSAALNEPLLEEEATDSEEEEATDSEEEEATDPEEEEATDSEEEEATDPEEEEATDPEDEEIVNPHIFLEAELMTGGFEIENYNFLEFTPLRCRPETT